MTIRQDHKLRRLIMKKLLAFGVCVLFLALLSVGFASGESIKLVWDPNSEPDLAGYKIYEALVNGGPYALNKDVGNVCELTLDMADKPDGTIYYVATAYDLRGNESGYSVQVFYVVDHTPPQSPVGCKVIEIK